MKLISYNVNGLRAAINKGFLDWLESANPDILCLQEIKATENQLDISLFEKQNYHTYWFPAEKKGYSGVSIFTKKEPENIKVGCDNPDFDKEGRILQIDYKDYSAISVYVPSASNMDRLGFKMDFCNYFLEYVKEIKKKQPNIIISGDFNICHHAIDIHDPIRNAKNSGFLPEERKWLTKFIEECGMVDSFREFVKEPHNYSWWSYRANARANNKGWRIDYNMVSDSIIDKLKRVFILTEAYQSDHCPVGIEINV